MSELRSVRSQLDHIAESADDATRGRYCLEHLNLADRVRVLDQKCSERERAIIGLIDDWNKFNHQYNEVCGFLYDLETNFPRSTDAAPDMEMLRQQMKLCRDAGDRLQAVTPRIRDVTEHGRVILQSVDSAHVSDQVTSLTDRVQHLTQKTSADVQR